jgi:hypothetical protein
VSERDEDNVACACGERDKSFQVAEAFEDVIETVENTANVDVPAVMLHSKRISLIPMHEEQTQLAVRFDRLHDVTERKLISGDFSKVGNDLVMVRRRVDGFAHHNPKPIPLAKKSPNNLLRVVSFVPVGLKLFKLFRA